MENVFRFVSLRGAQRAAEQDVQDKVIPAFAPVEHESPFLAAMRQASANGDAAAIAALLNGDGVEVEFVQSLEQVTPALVTLDRWLTDQKRQADPAKLRAFLQQLTDVSPDRFVQLPAYWPTRNKLTDTLLMLTIVPLADARRRTELMRGMYIFGLIEKLVAGRIKTADDINALLLDGIVVLPDGIFPLPEFNQEGGMGTFDPRHAMLKASGESTGGEVRSLAVPRGILPGTPTPVAWGTAVGIARPPGVADLKIVRQELQCYQMGEIAHIENVLLNEHMERVHRRKDTREESLMVDTEREEERENDLQSTTRFELQKEAAAITKSDTKLDVGLKVSASYGPVSVSANMGYASNTSKEESQRQSSTYARDVTERSAQRVQERVHELRSIRTVTEIEETNTHGIDNRGGTGHIRGIYRWVDKLYKAQTFNYGKRMQLEFLVPEPATFYRQFLKAHSKRQLTLKEPDVPMVNQQPLKASDLDTTSYLVLAAAYYAKGIVPPPTSQTVSLAWEEKYETGPNPDPTTPAKLIYKANKEITVPTGYKAVSFKGAIHSSSWKMDTYVTVGTISLRGDPNGGEAMPWEFNGNLSDEQGSLPVALTVVNTWGYVFALEITCDPTDYKMAEWRQSTYETIMGAYFELRSQYAEAAAAAGTQAGIVITGNNPDLNRQTELDELKKAVITLLTGNRFDLMGSIEQNTIPDFKDFSEIDVASLNYWKDFIQFFEQALEWENMTYLFYPYFWGRKSEWINLLDVDDPDPIFAGFLKAGEAQVSVPVRPASTYAMSLYLTTGAIWDGGGPAPQVNDPLYISIIQEIQEQQGAPVNGVADGDPWEVRLPTTLVLLQESGDLEDCPTPE